MARRRFPDPARNGESVDREPVDILLVDDRPSNLISLQAMLDRPDYRIATAGSGFEALARVLERDFAVILLDVAMPGMDGFETATLIKQRERSSKIPILFVTASIYDLDQVFRGYAVGAVDYLRKPVDATVVRAKVEVFVQLYRQQLQIRRQSERLHAVEERERLLLTRQAEEAIRQREAEYSVTFEEAPVGIARLGEDGRIQKANTELARLLGPELIGRTLAELLRGAPGDELQDCVSRVATGDAERIRLELAWSGAEGESWANLTLSALPGAPPAHDIVAVLEDITERRRAEQAQRLLEQAGAALLGTLDSRAVLSLLARLAVRDFAVWAMVDHVPDEDGGIEPLACAHADPEMELRLCRFRETHPPLVSRDIGPGRVFRRLDEETMQELAPDPEARRMLNEIRADSIVQVPVRASDRAVAILTVASTAEQRIFGEGDLATARELAHRAALAFENAFLYEQAAEAIRLRDEFLSIASHELRTPLTSLRLQVQTLLRVIARDGQADPTRSVALLERANRQVTRLASLVEGLLDVSRIREGALRLSTEWFDLADAVEEVVERSREDVRMSGSQVSVQIRARARGRRDRLRVEQVITNLLANALKYGCGRPIHLEVDERDDGSGVLVVRDEGIGIPPDKIERIFDRFERAVSALAYGGLGLGLYIVKQIVEAHGGSVSAMSEQGSGATFTVILPSEPEPASAGLAEEEAPARLQ